MGPNDPTQAPWHKAKTERAAPAPLRTAQEVKRRTTRATTKIRWQAPNTVAGLTGKVEGKVYVYIS